jgi:hypothetical protein
MGVSVRLDSRQIETIRFRLSQGRSLSLGFWVLRHKAAGGWSVFFPWDNTRKQKLHDLKEIPDAREALWVIREAVVAYPSRFSPSDVVDLVDLLTALVYHTNQAVAGGALSGLAASGS